MSGIKEFSSLPFIDLQKQQAGIREAIDQAIARVLDHGLYIMGPEVAEFERQLSLFCGAAHTVSCANGTDALSLALLTLGVEPGDKKAAIFVPSFTFAATAEVVALLGATVVFVDVLDDTFNMDPNSLKRGIENAKKLGLQPTGVIAVDLFGQPADYDTLSQIARENDLWLIADAAQSFGASYKGRSVGTLGTLTTTSFFPAKPLGCYGDGGAVFAQDEALASHLQSLRFHGKGKERYEHPLVGMTSRLDTIQAAILIEKLAIFGEEMKKREEVANKYSQLLANTELKTPVILEDCTSSYAQYTVCLPLAQDRDRLQQQLGEAGIPTMVYYPIPLHRQDAYKTYPQADGLEVSEFLSRCVLSLPMHPYLTQDAQEYIAGCLVKGLSDL